MTITRMSGSLYKRAKTGKIQEWNIRVEATDEGAIIIKEAGQLGGKMTVHAEAVRVGKNIGRSNETSPIEQATFQAESDYKKKQDEGYKSLDDLDITYHGSYVSHAGQDLPFEEMLNLRLPKDNTDASGNLKPMLATDWNKIKEIQYPVFVQPKLDGVRCLLIVKEGVVTFLSRSGKVYTSMGHIEEVIKKHPAFEDADCILDGELYAHTDVMSFQEVVSAVKKEKSSSKQIRFCMYDIVSSDQSQLSRLNMAKDVAEEFDNDLIYYVGHQEATSREEVIKIHDQYVSEGYEGAIIRLFDGRYSHSRSRDLLKVKVFSEAEFTFLGFEIGQREEDLIAVCDSPNGQFKAKMEGDRSVKRDLYNQYKGEFKDDGTKITIKHFGYTDGGLPRFPIGKAIRDYEQV